eukprot:gnl/MRDRNA2_/MRDRNA2_82592_c0_seq1.p1 gnl/MRDRNA2_/MRDRNA2_82592_c0~~gnl/MRDRNA2_/MRDRNA2_82592_c0_seq1.p1  ORF type:complete len:669 (+),score=129.71 gnl/MRDRNA2_/MRDRNA2_82592_c0_seq1:123-2129(+)
MAKLDLILSLFTFNALQMIAKGDIVMIEGASYDEKGSDHDIQEGIQKDGSHQDGRVTYTRHKGRTHKIRTPTVTSSWSQHNALEAKAQEKSIAKAKHGSFQESVKDASAASVEDMPTESPGALTSFEDMRASIQENSLDATEPGHEESSGASASLEEVRSSVKDALLSIDNSNLNSSTWMQNALVDFADPGLPIPNADDACETQGVMGRTCGGRMGVFRQGKYCFFSQGFFTFRLRKKARSQSCYLKPRYYPDRVLLMNLAREEAQMISDALDFGVDSGPLLISRLGDLHTQMKKVSNWKVSSMQDHEQGMVLPDQRKEVQALIKSFYEDTFNVHLEKLYLSVDAMYAENIKAKLRIIYFEYEKLATGARSQCCGNFIQEVWEKFDTLTASAVIGKLIDFGCEGSVLTRKFKKSVGGSIGNVLVVGPEYLKYKELAVKAKEGSNGPNTQKAQQALEQMGLSSEEAREVDGKGDAEAKKQKGKDPCADEEGQAELTDCIERQTTARSSSLLQVEDATRQVLAVARRYGWAEHNGTEISDGNHKELIQSAFMHMGNHYNHMMSIGDYEAAEQVEKDIDEAFSGPDTKTMMWFTWFVLGLVCAAACLWSWGTLCFCFYWMAFFFVMLQSISAILEVKKLANLRSDVKAGGVNGGQNSGHQGFDDRRRKWFR